MLNYFQETPTKERFKKIKETLIFSIDEQEAYHDQEANVILGFTPADERCMIQNTKYEDFLKCYDELLNRISIVQKTSKK